MILYSNFVLHNTTMEIHCLHIFFACSMPYSRAEIMQMEYHVPAIFATNLQNISDLNKNLHSISTQNGFQFYVYVPVRIFTNRNMS
jgi:hypothetical protein